MNQGDRVDLDTADDLIRYFDDVGMRSAREQRGRSIYRGVANAVERKLVPSLLRKDSEMKIRHIGNISPGRAPFTELTLRIVEAQILERFNEAANRSGLRVPRNIEQHSDRSLSLAIGLPHGFAVPTSGWLPSGLTELAALAQHYGLPTRLLDWTHDPLTAVFLAAANAHDELFEIAEMEDETEQDRRLVAFTSTRIGVWMLPLAPVAVNGCPLEVIYPPLRRQSESPSATRLADALALA